MQGRRTGRPVHDRALERFGTREVLIRAARSLPIRHPSTASHPYHTKKGVSQSAMTLLAQTSETYGATLSIANIPIILEHK